ncbi:TrmH family RNA methyltransferase [Sphingomonas flavalba]|uniref:TrmH family RNA methyltransferase n=1 Tax=Sphingomonas flavalba TaxID=2559804 RepID=UPI00109E0DC6|nr:TrmH family RNA methyltransferase [Sphingomonas flavalba]
MTFHVYMLRCADGSYYTGQTDTLDRRIAEHESGAIGGYTATRRPVALVWSEAFQTRDDARAAEARIKGWSRAKKEALIRGDWAALKTAAVPPAERGVREVPDVSDVHPLPIRPSTALGMDGLGDRDRDGDAQAPRPSPLSTHLSRAQSRDRPKHHRGAIPSAVERRTDQQCVELPPTQPVIVLVRPQLGVNIGKAARAMLNFGLTEMRLVAPRDGWPNPDAGPAASGADVVLERVRLFDTVAEAVADCAHVHATTVRKRGVTKPVLTPAQAADAIHGASGRSAILFGPERSGLETEDVALARTIVTVPINPQFGSLNLAQAVNLICYEWSKGEALASPTETPLLPPAPQVELDGLIAALEALLEPAGYFYPPDRAPATRLTLRTLLTKPGWNSLEVRTLRGVLSALARPRRR